MATVLEQIQQLNDKISAGQQRLSEINTSIAGPKASILDSTGCQPAYPWKENSNPPPYTGPNADLCRTYYTYITILSEEAKGIEKNIEGWENQIDILRKDPAAQVDIINADAAAKIKKYWTYALIAVVVIAGIVFIWYKWIRK